MRKFMCFLGIHRWTYYRKEGGYTDRFCPFCGTGQITYRSQDDRP